MKKRIETIYGYKKPGTSRFVVIAPHGAGDDLGSSIIASRLAYKLNAFLVVNTKFKKPSNKNIVDPNLVEDFNRLSWSTDINDYQWSTRRPEMKVFFSDIAKYCQLAHPQAKIKPTAVYIHSFTSDTIGIDIGAGLKKELKKAKLEGTKKHPAKNFSRGGISIKIGIVKKIQKGLEKKLEIDYNLATTVGQSYAGWSRRSAIQFHCNPPQDEYSIQFEINQILRKDLDNIKYTVNLLTEILTQYL